MRKQTLYITNDWAENAIGLPLQGPKNTLSSHSCNISTILNPPEESEERTQNEAKQPTTTRPFCLDHDSVDVRTKRRASRGVPEEIHASYETKRREATEELLNLVVAAMRSAAQRMRSSSVRCALRSLAANRVGRWSADGCEFGVYA